MLAQFRRSFLSADVFVRRAYSAINAVSPEEFLSRRNPEVKAVIEEIIPLAALLKRMDTPSRRVRCRYFGGGSSGFDAEIHVSGPEVDGGFLRPTYYLEVTTAEHPREYLRRESLRRTGSVYGGPGIRRTGSAARGTADVESFPVAVYGTVACALMAQWVTERIREKASRTYPAPCMLVINAVPEKPLNIREWANVADAAADELASTDFVSCWIAEWGTNNVIFSKPTVRIEDLSRANDA